MAKVVIFEFEPGRISVLFPATNFTAEQVARKDVPAGQPYFIVEEDELPEAMFQPAWEVDFSNPHGYSIGHEAWLAEQAEESEE
jgi:hypothetical protein